MSNSWPPYCWTSVLACSTSTPATLSTEVGMGAWIQILRVIAGLDPGVRVMADLDPGTKGRGGLDPGPQGLGGLDPGPQGHSRPGSRS